MKRAIVCVFAFALLMVIGVAAQNNKHFTKDGLSFDYPAGWTVTDESNSDAQSLTLNSSDSNAQVTVFVHRGKVNTPEKLALGKTKIVDPYLNHTEKQFVGMGAKPERTAATTQIAGVEAEGVRITAILDREPGEAGIYWVTVGERLVVLTLFGPDKAIKKAAPAWDAVRNSLKIEAAAPKATPSPSAKPKN